jgi:hypothetical protein
MVAVAGEAKLRPNHPVRIDPGPNSRGQSGDKSEAIVAVKSLNRGRFLAISRIYNLE